MLTSIKEILAAISKLFSSSKNESHSHNSTDPPAQGISSEGEIPAVNLTTVTVTDHGSGLNDDVTRTGLSTGDIIPIVGLALMIFICLVAFVWGANSAKRRKDRSYALRNSRSRQYRTFNLEHSMKEIN